LHNRNRPIIDPPRANFKAAHSMHPSAGAAAAGSSYLSQQKKTPAAKRCGRRRQKVGRGASRQAPSYPSTKNRHTVRLPDGIGCTIHAHPRQIQIRFFPTPGNIPPSARKPADRAAGGFQTHFPPECRQIASVRIIRACPDNPIRTRFRSITNPRPSAQAPDSA
jgi:hypothetical protein